MTEFMKDIADNNVKRNDAEAVRVAPIIKEHPEFKIFEGIKDKPIYAKMVKFVEDAVNNNPVLKGMLEKTKELSGSNPGEGKIDGKVSQKDYDPVGFSNPGQGIVEKVNTSQGDVDELIRQVDSITRELEQSGGGDEEV